MSEWIESHTALREHPKLRRLARLLGINRREATGLLHWLWWWAMDYAPDGNLSAYTEEDIADGLDWEGDAKALIGFLREAGFIDKKQLRLHDWEDYGGRLFRRRKHNAERMREARARDVDDTDDGTCAARALHVSDTSRATGQDRTGQTEEDIPKEEAAVVAHAREAVENRGGGFDEESTEDDPLLWDLWEVPGWPRDDALDRKELADVRRDYPRANLSEVIADLRAAGSLQHPRKALRAFAKQAHESTPRGRPSPPVLPAVPELTPEQRKAQVLAAAKARRQIEAMAAGARGMA